MIRQNNDYQFGDCSINTLALLPPPAQYELHNSQNTNIYFTTKEQPVRFIFYPLHSRKCNLTFHEYEILCSIPSGTPEDSICRRSITEVAQRLYELYFSRKAGYKLEILESEIQTSIESRTLANRLEPTDHHATSKSFVFWGPKGESFSKHPPSFEHYSKCQKPSSDVDFIPWKSEEAISIHDVKAAYSRAIEKGQLRSSSLPQLRPSASTRPLEASNSHARAFVERWDPYTIEKHQLRNALLDEEKLCGIKKQLKRTALKVPETAKWNTQVEEYGLTPSNILAILRVAFGCDEVYQTRQPNQKPVDKIPRILSMASFLLHRADNLDAQQSLSAKATAVARIIGYALMRVYEVTEGLTPSQVSKHMKKFFVSNDDNQKRSRNLACFWSWTMARLPGFKGRELQLYLLLMKKSSESALRELFQPTVPAAAGEFVSVLCTANYSQHIPKSTGVPSVVEIVRALLGDDVSNVTICRALGCPDTYLDNFEECFPESFQFLRLRTTQNSIDPWREPALFSSSNYTVLSEKRKADSELEPNTRYRRGIGSTSTIEPTTSPAVEVGTRTTPPLEYSTSSPPTDGECLLSPLTSVPNSTHTLPDLEKKDASQIENTITENSREALESDSLDPEDTSIAGGIQTSTTHSGVDVLGPVSSPAQQILNMDPNLLEGSSYWNEMTSVYWNDMVPMDDMAQLYWHDMTTPPSNDHGLT